MARLGEHVDDGAGFDDPAGIHDSHPVAGGGDDAEVVGDQHDAHRQAVAQIEQQFQDLVLDRHVERCRRLVGQQQFWRTGERDGDHRPLAHAAGELMRIFVQPPFRVGDTDDGHQLQCPCTALAATEAGMSAEIFLDLQSDRQHRIERRHRLLENHRDFAAADAPELLVGHGDQVAAAPLDAAGDLARLTDQPHDGAQGNALSRAGFADQADDFAGRDIEIDIGGGNRLAPRCFEGGRQAANDQSAVVACRYHRRILKSSATPSPARLNPSPVRTIEMPGNTEIHQAVVM